MDDGILDAATRDALAAFPKALRAHLALFPVAHRHWAPASWEGVPSEPFTAIEQLCHVLDIEVEGYQQRIRRTRDETEPFLPSIDGEALARDRDYAHADAETVLARVEAARRDTLALLDSLQPSDWQRRATLEGYGPLTLRGLVHFLCSHDQQHLAGLQWLLGKRTAGPT